MPGVVPDQGIQDALDDLLATTEWANAKLRLFSNNVTPTTSDTPSTYTESSFSGYSAVTLSGWSAASVSAHVATSTATPITFTITSGSATVYGWYITNSAGTRLLAAQRDASAPVSLSSTGTNTYSVTQSFTTQSA